MRVLLQRPVLAEQQEPSMREVVVVVVVLAVEVASWSVTVRYVPRGPPPSPPQGAWRAAVEKVRIWPLVFGGSL